MEERDNKEISPLGRRRCRKVEYLSLPQDTSNKWSESLESSYQGRELVRQHAFRETSRPGSEEDGPIIRPRTLRLFLPRLARSNLCVLGVRHDGIPISSYLEGRFEKLLVMLLLNDDEYTRRASIRFDFWNMGSKPGGSLCVNYDKLARRVR